MKVDGLTPNIPQPKPVKQEDPVKIREQQQKQIEQQIQQEKAAKMVNENKGEKKAIQLSKTASKEIMKNYAEYYFKQGKQMEQVKNYRQAISAYERSNIVAPDISKASSADGARKRLYGG